MPDRIEIKRKVVGLGQRYVVNPIARRLPIQTLVETTGRKSGLPRRTPLGGRRIGDAFWFVSEYGERSDYIRNIMANPRIRVRLRGRWYPGVAHLVPSDDARRRLRELPRFNSTGVLVVGGDLLTVRVDLDPGPGTLA
ncbi:nitroreductase/quinone reductase family protein [Nocardia sp. NPDC051570]|uniref:nitroreductase/quinone reductase family protein n=1 Tax=Nocardia sp. NPDC051570 TaxID=3364324 RepID=UPI0037B7D168